jgi:hypothetical protein
LFLYAKLVDKEPILAGTISEIVSAVGEGLLYVLHNLCFVQLIQKTSFCTHVKPGVLGVLLASSHPFLHSSGSLFILLSNLTDSTKESPE